jgi:hypothetical protein
MRGLEGRPLNVSPARKGWGSIPVSVGADSGFPTRGTINGNVCGFLKGKPHELDRNYEARQGSRGICSSAAAFASERELASCKTECATGVLTQNSGVTAE